MSSRTHGDRYGPVRKQKGGGRGSTPEVRADLLAPVIRKMAKSQKPRMIAKKLGLPLEQVKRVLA